MKKIRDEVILMGRNLCGYGGFLQRGIKKENKSYKINIEYVWKKKNMKPYDFCTHLDVILCFNKAK